MKQAFQIILFVLLALVGGCGFLVEVPLVLMLGWVHFLTTIPPHVTVNLSMVAVGLAIIPILGMGVHRVLAWLHLHSHATGEGSLPHPWRWTWSLAVLTIFLLMFITSIAAIGMLHQALWLVTDPEPPLTDAQAGSPTTHTKLRMEFSGKALSTCLNDRGSLPQHPESISLRDVKLPEPCSSAGLSAKDGWGTPLRYTSNGRSYVLTSYGRNKAPGGGTGGFDDYLYADGQWIYPVINREPSP